MKIFRRFWWLFLILVLFLIGTTSTISWASDTAEPMPEALLALESDDQVTVETDPWLVFSPNDTEPSVGFIFYPGGKVDPRAYAPAAHTIASQGYLVVIPPMPLNLAVLAPNKAQEIMQTYPEIDTWIIGGHSLGGAMAAAYMYKNPDSIDGLSLWAAYPAENNSLSDRTSLKVVSISASLDGLATPEKIQASYPLLPPETSFVVIEGGNHAQFGWYGPQEGDNEATITREEQQKQAIEATLKLLGSLK